MEQDSEIMNAVDKLKQEYPHIPPEEIDAIARSIRAGAFGGPNALTFSASDVEQMIYNETPTLLKLRGLI
jgi:hypothetical protein